MSAAAGSDARTLRKLQLGKTRLQVHYEAGEFYEAQQVAKTLYRRAVLANALPFASELICETTVQLIEAKQYLAASDLALLLLDCLGKRPEGSAISAEDKESIFKLLAAFPEGQESAAISFGLAAVEFFAKRDKVAAAAAAGAQQAPPPPSVGIPELHLRLARLYKRQKDFASAHKHYLRSGAPAEHALTLQAWSLEGHRSERDLYIARAVLQSLCLQNLKHANTLLRLYLKTWERRLADHPEPEGEEEAEDPLQSPLMNFISFLLKTVERDAAPLFRTLCQKYAVSLARDDSFSNYLDRIGEIYFGIKAYRGMLDILGDLL